MNPASPTFSSPPLLLSLSLSLLRPDEDQGGVDDGSAGPCGGGGGGAPPAVADEGAAVPWRSCVVRRWHGPALARRGMTVRRRSVAVRRPFPTPPSQIRPEEGWRWKKRGAVEGGDDGAWRRSYLPDLANDGPPLLS